MRSNKEDKRDSFKSRIVLTGGPASCDWHIMNEMAKICSGIRLNTAHLSADDLKTWLVNLNKLRIAGKKSFEIILDLQGAKVRIGRIPEVPSLPDTVEIFYGEISGTVERIPVFNENVFAKTQPGERLFLNDRKVILEVIEKKDYVLTAKVLQNGPLSSGKGLNSPDRVFEMARVTESDKRAIEQAQHYENMAYAVSFVANGYEYELFKPLTGEARLIAKIEQVAAFSHLDIIWEKFDELWLCRGDLGAEAGLRKLGLLQNDFVGKMHNFAKPALIAGEVLGSMVNSKLPSRAEIVHLYDCLNNGFAGFVLSDETACGKNVSDVLEFLKYYFSIV
ncbi:MAG: hypothetical protein Kow0029_13280 [Candidatus Rifleibacteriota bacterium]